MSVEADRHTNRCTCVQLVPSKTFFFFLSIATRGSTRPDTTASLLLLLLFVHPERPLSGPHQKRAFLSLSRSLCVLSISTGAPPNASSDSFNNLDDTPRGRQLSNAPRAERPLWLPVVKPGKKEKYIFLRGPSQQ